MSVGLRYYVIYKPFGVLPQFTDSEGRPTLASLGDFPRDVYPVGRLDLDSEGLLILTNDKTLNHRLLDPKYHHWRTYWVQVDGDLDEAAIEKLISGVTIKPRKVPYLTREARARMMPMPDTVPDRDPPIRYRKEIPTSWLELSLTEGKYRQVRKMTAAVGFPTLRLIRAAVERLEMVNWQPGSVVEYSRADLYGLLFDR